MSIRRILENLPVDQWPAASAIGILAEWRNGAVGKVFSWDGVDVTLMTDPVVDEFGCIVVMVDRAEIQGAAMKIEEDHRYTFYNLSPWEYYGAMMVEDPVRSLKSGIVELLRGTQ